MATATSPVTAANQRKGRTMPVALAASVQIYKGRAAGYVAGTGYGTPLVPATSGMTFQGIWNETLLEATGVAGSTFTTIERDGCFFFDQTGTTITNAHIGLAVFFADDHTVQLAASACWAGTIVALDAAGNVWVDISNAVKQSGNLLQGLTALSGSADAISPHISAAYVVTKAGVDSMTLAAPTATTDDGVLIEVISGTKNAHTITATTAILNVGNTSDYATVLTFTAHIGAVVRLKAYQAAWYCVGAVGVTATS